MIAQTPLIPQNIAPPGAVSAEILNTEGKKIGKVNISAIKPKLGRLLRSFGLAGDIHLWISDGVSWHPNTKFDKTLTFFEEEGCAFCVVCGDLTQTGFYRKVNESDPDEVPYLEELQMAKYKELCDKHPALPVYEIAGNHESYHGMPITNNLDKWETYTGRSTLSYTVEMGNDIFVFLGEPNQSDPITVEGKTMLQGLLDDPANADKRFIVFIHSYLEEDSGDPYDYRENSIFEKTSNPELTRAAFIDLLAGRGNLVLFHAHSHMKFEHQKGDVDANFTAANGFASVHVPSLSRPRNVNREGTTQDTLTPYDNVGGEGYVVEMYEDCIVLKGFSLDDGGAPAWSTIARYMIGVATTIVEGVAGLLTSDGYALTDSTGARLIPKEDK